MTKQTINVGTSANDRKGDSLRTAFQKVNANFTELYTTLGLTDTTLNLGNFVFTENTISLTNSNNDDSTATQIEIAQPVRIESDLTVGGDILPNGNLTTNLGSPTNKFHSIYVGTGSVYIGDAKLSLDGGKISSSVGFDLTDSVGGGGGSSVTTGDTAPTSPDVGDLWYDTASGRTYVYYDSTWVDANPVDGAGINSTDRLVNGSAEVVLGSNGVLTFPNGETLVSQPSQLYFHKDDNDYVGEIVLQAEGVGIQATHPTLGTSLINISTNGATISINDNEWEFDRSGTLTTPLLLPKTFTAVLDNEHMSSGTAISGDAWEYPIEFQVSPDGEVVSIVDGNRAWPTNPGYADGDEFEFAEADHGIPGFTFLLTLAEVVDLGPTGFGGNIAVSMPPDYPSTIASTGSIKLSATDNSWIFGTNGQLTVPGAIRKDGGLYMNSGGDGISSTVLVNGTAGSVVLRTDDGTSNKSLTLDVDGETSFPGRLNFADGSTYDNSTLTGAVDSDLALEVKHTTSISHACYIGTEGEFVADIELNDDITVADVGWTVVIGDTTYTVESVVEGAPANQFRLVVPGATFVTNETYTFTNPVPVSNVWTINSQNGTLIAPGNAILSNETADLGEGDTYRDFSIELPTVDGQNEKRWSFINDGRLLLGADAGAIYADQTSGRVSIGDSIADGGAPTMPSSLIHIGGGEALVISRGNGTNNPSWTFGDDGNTTLPVASSLVVEGTTYTQLADAETTYTDNEVMYQDALTQWMTDAAFKPVWYALSGREAYDIIMAWTTPDGITPPPSNLVPIANSCKNSYLTWQDLIAESKLAVKSDTTSFEFDSAGKLTLPHGGTIAGGDPTSVQAAYDAWQAMEDDWTYLITEGGLRTEPRPWTYAAPGDRQTTLTTMWQAQQGTDTLDWEPISASFYNQVRAWLAINTNSAALYDEWKKLSTSVNITAEDSTWAFTNDGAITFPDDTVQTTAYTGLQTSLVSPNTNYNLTANNYGVQTNSPVKWVEGTDERVVLNYVPGDDRFVLVTNSSNIGNQRYWYFGDNGNLTLPASGDVVNSTGVSQLANRVEGSWTVTAGTSTYSFTVPMDGTYTMWVKGNIPNGIITWNATLSVTNSNVPAIGTQYAWNYTGGGSPILLTAIPDQIRGAAGTISTDATYAGTTSNRFDFGISNTSGASQTIYYGYTKV